MKKVLFGLAAVAILTGGASCANPFVKDDSNPDYPTDSTPSTSGAMTNTKPAPATTAVSTQPTAPVLQEGSDSLPPDLLLYTVEAQGNQVVKIEFSSPDELAKTVSAYRIMMSKDSNPTVANSTDWYELGPAHRSKLWTVNGTGQRYVKICAVKDNTCTAVSPVVPVEVK